MSYLSLVTPTPSPSWIVIICLTRDPPVSPWRNLCMIPNLICEFVCGLCGHYHKKKKKEKKRKKTQRPVYRVVAQLKNGDLCDHVKLVHRFMLLKGKIWKLILWNITLKKIKLLTLINDDLKCWVYKLVFFSGNNWWMCLLLGISIRHGTNLHDDCST